MSDIKMSDVFKDGCQQFDLFLVDDYTDPDELHVIADFDKDYVKSVSEKMASYAAHAINNHDRLVEENKELREVLVKNEEFITWLIENLPKDVLDEISEPLSETTNRNLRLLYKVRGNQC